MNTRLQFVSRSTVRAAIGVLALSLSPPAHAKTQDPALADLEKAARTTRTDEATRCLQMIVSIREAIGAGRFAEAQQYLSALAATSFASGTIRQDR